MNEAVGIDVSKAALDVAIHGQATAWRFANTPGGRRKLASWLLARHPHQVVLEATGGYEQAALDALHAAGLPVVRVNPRQARDFAKATGQLAKTDRLDARVLAQMAGALELVPYQPKAAWQRQLDEWIQRRRHIVDMQVAERQRLRALHDPVLRGLVTGHLRSLATTLRRLDREIQERVRARPELAALRSLKGVGPVLQATLACQLPELGQIDGKAVAKLVGVAPLARDSGTLRGRRTIWGGRAALRHALYMAALSAARQEPGLRDFYLSLRARGKAAKVAIVAVMRKLLVILNARMRDQRLGQTTAA